MKFFQTEQASFFHCDRQGRTYIPSPMVCAFCEASLKKLIIRFSNSAESKHMTCGHTAPFLLPALFVKSWVASNDFVDTQSLFLRAMLSATSLTASIAFVYTLPYFQRKSVCRQIQKTCWENPNPLAEISLTLD